MRRLMLIILLALWPATAQARTVMRITAGAINAYSIEIGNLTASTGWFFGFTTLDTGHGTLQENIMHLIHQVYLTSAESSTLRSFLELGCSLNLQSSRWSSYGDLYKGGLIVGSGVDLSRHVLIRFRLYWVDQTGRVNKQGVQVGLGLTF